jgi:MFS family permease
MPGSLRVLRAVVRSPALRRVMVAFLLFNAFEYATWIAILLYAYDATGPASVGVVGMIQLVPSALFAATAAAVADRYRRDRVLLAGYLAQAAMMALTAAGMLLGAPPLVVYLFATATACAITLTRPTQGALLPSLARTPEELTAANGLAGSMEGVGTLVGPLAAAAILVVASPGSVFVAGTITALAAALLVLRLPTAGGRAVHVHEPDNRHDDGTMTLERESGRRRLVHGLHALTAQPDAGLVVGILSVRMLVMGALDVLYVLLAIEVLGTGEPGAGVLTAAMGLGTIAGGAMTFALVGRRHLAPVLAAGSIGVGLALAVLGGVGSVGIAAVLLVVAGAGFAIIDVAGRTVLQRVAQDEVLARLLGALEGIGMASIAVGTLLVPLVAGIAGITGAILVTAMIMPAAVGLAWLRLRRIDARVSVPVRELALLRRNLILWPLPAPQLESVARRTRWITAEPGEVLIREGDVGDRFYVLASGEWRITRGGTVLRALSTPGDGVGDIALLRDVPRTATVTATGHVVALALERADFLEAVTGHEHAPTADGGRRGEYAAGHVESDPVRVGDA